jgi:hypothetical protein
MSKLTLHVPESLVVAAKQEAAMRKTSVSRLVADYFRALAAKPMKGLAEPLPPVTASLVGCLQGAKDDRESHADYLEQKHS